MSTDTGSKVYEQVFNNLRTAAEANLKMQQDVMQQWVSMFPGLPMQQSPLAEKMRDFQHRWASTVSDLWRKHRDSLDKQYEAALQSLEEALRVSESTNAEEFRERSEQLCRKTLDCMREVSEAQVKAFQEAMGKWGELVTQTKS